MYFAVNLLFFFTMLYSADHANGLVIRDLNSLCHSIANCRQVRTHDNSPGVSNVKPCSCHRMCSQFDTCCLDAPGTHSKQSKVKSVCRRGKLPKSYFMVDRCSSGGDDNSVWEQLCNDERKAEDEDLMGQVPVTSLFTSITYKNYFCLRCQETTDDFVYWNLQLWSNATKELGPDMKHDKLVYSRQNKTWLIRLEKSQTWLPVDWYLRVPSEVDPLQVECMPDIISQCNSSWPDDSVSRKCHSYTSIIYVWRNKQKLKYRNPHCAACSYEDLSKIICESGNANGNIRSAIKNDTGSIIDKYDDSYIRNSYRNDSSRDRYAGGSGRERYDDKSNRDRYAGNSSGDRYTGGSNRDRYDDRYRDRDDDRYRDRDDDRYRDRDDDRYRVRDDDRYRDRYDDKYRTRDRGDGGKILFSFTHLLDINRSDGDKVGKIKMCEDDSLWDPWADTCRELSCAIPGHILQGRKCVPP